MTPFLSGPICRRERSKPDNLSQSASDPRSMVQQKNLKILAARTLHY